MIINARADASRKASTSRVILSTLPTSRSTTLNNNQFRSSLSRLLCTNQPSMQGAKQSDTCQAVGKDSGKICGKAAGITGLHPTQCHCGGGFNKRHDEFAKNVSEMWASAGVVTKRETTNIGNGTKPLAAPRAGRKQPKRSRDGESDCITPDVTLYGSDPIRRYIDVTTVDRQTTTNCKTATAPFDVLIKKAVDKKMLNTYRAEWLSVPVSTVHVLVISATGDLCKATCDQVKEAAKLANAAGKFTGDEFTTYWRRKIVFAHVRMMGDTAETASGAFYGDASQRGGRTSAREAAAEFEATREARLCGLRHALPSADNDRCD
jgi:hypothetical protein